MLKDYWIKFKAGSAASFIYPFLLIFRKCIQGWLNKCGNQAKQKGPPESINAEAVNDPIGDKNNARIYHEQEQS